MFQAPEVYNEPPVLDYTDVFALGMMTWEMFADVMPYANKISDEAVKKAVCSGERPDLNMVPQHYHHIITQCWEHGLFVMMAMTMMTMMMTMTMTMMMMMIDDVCCTLFVLYVSIVGCVSIYLLCDDD